MTKTCHCGHWIDSYLEDLGCLECGASCCPACSYSPEAIVHCASCAQEIFNIRTHPLDINSNNSFTSSKIYV